MTAKGTNVAPVGGTVSPRKAGLRNGRFASVHTSGRCRELLVRALVRAKTSSNQAGLTLIEILAVVGIIAILAALLFPMGSRTIDAARRAQCTSNLRQVAIVLKAYMAENNNYFPPGNATTSIPGISWKGAWYAPSSGVETSPAAYAGTTNDLARITVCPNNRIAGTNYPYCVNYNVMVASGALAAVKYLNVSKPSQVVWMADSAVQGDWGLGVQTTSSGWTRLANRHNQNQQMNVLWVDSHITLNNRDSDLTNNSSFKIN